MAFWSALFPRPSQPPVRPSQTLFFLLVGAFLLTLVPHVERLPIWVTVAVILAMIVRSVLENYRMPLPSVTFCGVVAICLVVGILAQFSTVFGRDPGTALTAGLLAIKFYELRGPRDVALIIFSCFFVIMSALLYSQVVELFIYCLIMMWVLTALLIRTQMGDWPEDHLLRLLNKSALIFAQALPLTICLFFFFPRFSGKLQLNLDEVSVGLTSRIEPGSIVRLANNDSEAMRVVLTGNAIPTPDSMYWRAMVLWHYEGGAWTQGEEGLVPATVPPRGMPNNSTMITQEITMWPHEQRWLIALDYPVTLAVNSSVSSESSPWSLFLEGGVLQLGDSDPRVKLDHKERYTVTSAFQVVDEIPSPDEQKAGIQLPKSEIDPRVKALANQLHRENPDPQDYVRAILHYFRLEGFKYSMSPGKEGPDWLGDFLFKTKTGFCEHYASAFAILMRLERIPARLVVGYQGAEYNPYGSFYVVRQSDAHAWDEVWIPAKNHWVRVDPTAVLSQAERTPGSSNTSDNADSDQGFTIRIASHQSAFSQPYVPHWLKGGLQEWQFRREQVEADWDNLVFAYNPEAQNRLAQSLGFGRETRSMLVLVCLVAVGICIVVFQNVLKRKPPPSPVENLYATFCRNMAQRGIPRATWEGPFAYTERVAEAFPDKKEAIQGVGWIVARSRYGSAPPDPAATGELKSLLTLIMASQAASSSRDHD